MSTTIMNKSDVQPTSIGPYKSWWSKVGCKKWARTRAGRPGHRARQIYCWGLLDRGVLPLVVVLADAPDGPDIAVFNEVRGITI